MKALATRYAHRPPRIGTERRVPTLRVVEVLPEAGPVPLPILIAATWAALVVMTRVLGV
jgi:hypothetical protein